MNFLLFLPNTNSNICNFGNQAQFSRLPTDIQPIHYNLHIIPDLDNFTFSGEQEIFVNVSEYLFLLLESLEFYL